MGCLPGVMFDILERRHPLVLGQDPFDKMCVGIQIFQAVKAFGHCRVGGRVKISVYKFNFESTPTVEKIAPGGGVKKGFGQFPIIIANPAL